MGYSVIDKNFWASLVKKSCQLDHYRPSYDQLKFSQMFGATYDLRRLSELPKGTLNIAKNGVTFLKSTVLKKFCPLEQSPKHNVFLQFVGINAVLLYWLLKY